MKAVTIDRGRLAGRMADEVAQFETAHPRSKELFKRAEKSLLGGVPMSWMVSYFAHPPLWVDEGHGAHFTCADGRRFLDVMRRIDDHDLVGVTDAPDVVVDVEVLAVEAEDTARDEALDRGCHASNFTTERSTSPWCIFSNAASTSPMPIVSDTKSCNGSLPCR